MVEASASATASLGRCFLMRVSVSRHPDVEGAASEPKGNAKVHVHVL